ncbi:MAG: class I mannose-6-phosphate isomerase [Oscillospiraceae bacterium]|nr:class I mannose-6-phosphate isomerase [Oscillospiraceae bacterium]
MDISPFKLKPTYKDYIWGGNKLKKLFGKKSGGKIAESWELSCHPDGQSVIADGPHKGKTLLEFLTACGQPPVPFLIKLIDASDNLSVQVHPDDDYARIHENDSGKTEMWYVLEADESAFIFLGFNREMSREALKNRVESNEITDVLCRKKVTRGDVIFIPAGTIHAIGKGVVLAEVQQCSNATYRVYDFGRLGKDGNPRPLHLDKALDVTDYRAYKEPIFGAKVLSSEENYVYVRLAKCDYFCVDKLSLKDEAAEFVFKRDKSKFGCLLCIDGAVALDCGGHSLALSKGETAFFPASTKKITVKGIGEVVITYDGK